MSTGRPDTALAPRRQCTGDREAWLVLARAPGLGSRTLISLLGRLGSPSAVASAGRHELRELGVPESAIRYIAAPDEARLETDLRWLGARAHDLLPWTSAAYPELLREIPDPPALLFVRGDPAVLSEPQLAMVGSRNPTPGGRETGHQFAAHLARCGLTITSGLAHGIDAACHSGALAGGGSTVAVLGSGVDVIYPAEHAELADRVAERGVLVSELPTATPPKREHFPRRNRLISGLALGTLVVEAAERSGSLITARLAGEQGREVFAIPGSIHNPLARGCHRLIRQGAKLVESAQDILEELGPLLGVLDVPRGESTPRTEAAESPDPEYSSLLGALGYEPASVDLLVSRSGLTPEVVSSMLLILELKGDVRSVPGGLYMRTAGREP